MDTNMDAMIAERKSLVEDTYLWDSSAFPGSKQWRGYTSAWDKVTAFDAAHPEVLPEVHRRKTAEVLGDKDVMGL